MRHVLLYTQCTLEKRRRICITMLRVTDVVTSKHLPPPGVSRGAFGDASRDTVCFSWGLWTKTTISMCTPLGGAKENINLGGL